MTIRIEDISGQEHVALIQAVHPQVSEIKEKVKDVADAVGQPGSK